MAYTREYQERVIQLLWVLTGGKSFFHKNISPAKLGQGHAKSVSVLISKLTKLGWLVPLAGRGEYDFAKKAKALFVQPSTPVADIESKKRRGGEPLQDENLFLTPEEYKAFELLCKCQPKKADLPGGKKKDRITEKDINFFTPFLSAEEKEKFLQKMEKWGVLIYEGDGTKGRIFHFNLVRYLELEEKKNEKIHVLLPVQKKYLEIEKALAEKRQSLKKWTDAESGLSEDLQSAEELLQELQEKLVELNKKISETSTEVQRKRNQLEEVRHARRTSQIEIEIGKMEKEMPVLEALAKMDKREQWEFLQSLCPRT